MFDEEEDFYNVVFADKELNIDSGRIYSTLTKKQIKSAADIYVDLMQSFIVMIAGGSLDLSFEPWTYVIIYAVVMLTYFVISTILVRRIDKVKPIEVLKNRE